MEILFGGFEEPQCIYRAGNSDLYLASGELPVLNVSGSEVAVTNAVLMANKLPKLEEWFANNLPLQPLIDLFTGTSVVALFGPKSCRGALGLVLARLARDRLLQVTGQNSMNIVVDMVRMFYVEYRSNPERSRRILDKTIFRWDVVEIKLQEQIEAYKTP